MTILDNDDYAAQLWKAVGWGTTGFVNGVMTAAFSILREVEWITIITVTILYDDYEGKLFSFGTFANGGQVQNIR